MNKLNSLHQSKTTQKDSMKYVIQLIDMSDKILYNEVKAKEKFASVINAAVSHELRNPLNSLVG